MSGTKDTNWRSYTGDKPDVSDFINPSDPENYSDIMKFSDCTDAVIDGKTVAAGQENCIDAVRGSDYLWENCTMLEGAGISTVTLKGAIDGFTFRNCTINHGVETDLELGQFDKYWYPGRPATRGGLIDNCHASDSRPIQVTCWNADKPEVMFSNVSIQSVPWLIWFPYFCFRYVWIRIFP